MQGALLFHALDARITPQLTQLTASAQAHISAFIERCGGERVECSGGIAEDAQHRHLSRVVPHARRDDPAGAQDAPHLCDGALGVLDDVKHELREHHIEAVIGEGQRLGDAEMHLGARNAAAAGLHERLVRSRTAAFRGPARPPVRW